MKSKAGYACMIFGAALILSALLLLLYNQREDETAGAQAAALLPQVRTAIDEEEIKKEQTEATEPEAAISTEMTVKEIDGYGYIGYVSIPTLGLELPVMSEWDYDRLKIAPCRQYGSTKTDDLVIAGHNYVSHFGKLENLSAGDVLTFTDMDGVTGYYRVSCIEELRADESERMLDSEWALTLYTCTYSGTSRITVRCERIKY